jgi:hypothetical protein
MILPVPFNKGTDKSRPYLAISRPLPELVDQSPMRDYDDWSTRTLKRRVGNAAQPLACQSPLYRTESSSRVQYEKRGLSMITDGHAGTVTGLDPSYALKYEQNRARRGFTLERDCFKLNTAPWGEDRAIGI